MFEPFEALPDLAGRIVVVTGGTAGVGRAVARLCGRRGATVVILARDTAGLEDARAEIAATGARVLALPVDVADADLVFAAAERVEAELGPIDVWINNAMATVFSPVADITPEEVRRVTEVTYLGSVHGTMAALRHMRRRDRGVIVQIGSSLAYRGIPLQAAYCGAKHAIRGFLDSLRAELAHEGSRVRLTHVHLPAINTPQFEWARTHRSHRPRPVAPVYSTAAAARAILGAIASPDREVWVGGNTTLMILGNMLLPQVFDRLLAAQAVEGQDRPERVGAERRDNLFTPVAGVHRTDGPFGDETRARAVAIPGTASRLAATGVALLAAAGLAGLAVATAAGRGDRRSQT
jgi:NAD(P)-dependent dehydrogenase (short-subunit alcohol dehydrogenase family)